MVLFPFRNLTAFTRPMLSNFSPVWSPEWMWTGGVCPLRSARPWSSPRIPRWPLRLSDGLAEGALAIAAPQLAHISDGNSGSSRGIKVVCPKLWCPEYPIFPARSWAQAPSR